MLHRVAVIGAGIGAEHCDALAALDAFDIATICDRDDARGRALATKFGAGFVADIAAVLDDPAIDIVDICLPSYLHFPTAMAALDAGKIVVVEKPLCGSLAEADALAAKSEATGRPIFPVFQYRYGPGTMQLRALMAAGCLGQCYGGTLETHWNRDAAYYQNPWRGTWAGEGGGVLVTHAIHIHDLVDWLIGPVVRVQAALATRVNAIEVDDCAALILEMASGALVTSSVTLGAATDTSRLRFMFERATVTSATDAYAPASRAWQFEARSPQDQAEIEKVLATIKAPETGYRGFFGAIANALAGDGEEAVPLGAARQSVELITAAYAASRGAGPQSLPIRSNHPLYEGWHQADRD